MLAGFAVDVAAIAWAAAVAGGLAWLAIPVWAMAMGRIRAGSPDSPCLGGGNS